MRSFLLGVVTIIVLQVLRFSVNDIFRFDLADIYIGVLCACIAVLIDKTLEDKC
jgi:hypothetical protein